jgi:hypothetical protein
MSTFEEELTALINKHSKEGDSHTPDFILAMYLGDCLQAQKRRSDWYDIPSESVQLQA